MRVPGPIAWPIALFLAACSAQPSTGSARQAVPSPPTRGMDAIAMARVVGRAERLPRLRSLLVLRHGRELAAHRFNGGPDLDRPVNIKSASKTVLSALVGIAIARGVLSGLDQPIAPVFRADLPPNPDPRLGRMTVDHLLSMRSGLQRTSGEYYGRWVSSPNWVRHILSRPFVSDPGGGMIYSTGNSHLLSAMLTRVSGRDTLVLARDWLGEPLGIRIPAWPRDPQGIYSGGNDMLLSPRALARFGELYRNDGVVGGRRVLPAGWVRDGWRSRGVSPWSGEGYGLGWFVSEAAGRPVYFAWGYGGQMLYVVPDLSLTVVMTSDPTPQERGDHVASLHALLADGIIPAAVAGSARPAD